MALDTTGRHPSTQQIARFFSKLPAANADTRVAMDEVRSHCEQLAGLMLTWLPDGPELTAGLRKLLEAKDCFVRALL